MKNISLLSQSEQSMPHLSQFHPSIVNLGKEAQQLEAIQQSPGARAWEREKLAPPAAKSSRLFFIDSLRAFLIILVITLHLAFTYGSSINLWYYHDTTDALTDGSVTSLIGIGQAFCLGLFFLISAYFTPGTYERKGAGPFLRDRLLRLGLPLLIYDILINPFVVYIASGFRGSYWQFYPNYLLSLRGIGQGPSWFIEALLFFVMFYALGRVCFTWWLHALPRMTTPTRSITSERLHPYPTTGAMLLYIVGLALITFVIRIWLPMGWWFQPLNLMFGAFPQYNGIEGASIDYFLGGRLWNFLSANAYAASIFQSVILVGLAYSMHTVELHPLLKFGIAVIIAVPLCFLISSVIRKIPFVNRVL